MMFDTLGQQFAHYTQPLRPAPPQELRRQLWLSRMGLSLFLFSIVAAPFTLLLPTDPGALYALFGLAFWSFVAHFITYLLARWAHLQLAAFNIIFTLTAIPYALFIFGPENGVFEASLTFLAISALLGDYLLSRRYVYALILMGWALIALAPMVNSNAAPERILGYFFINTALVTVFLVISDLTKGIEQDRRTELELLNSSLEERVQVRTQELASAKHKAEESDAAKSAFLASMSHELRTPLNAIINLTTFVVEKDLGDLNTDQEETLGQVVISSKHLMNLINDVLDMSKIESRSLRLFITEGVDLGQILQQTLRLGHSLLPEYKHALVRFESHIPADLPPIRGDKQRLLQIFLNIMSNACKFTESGQITLRAEVQGDSVRVSLQDTGPGIPPEDWSAVFEPFRQTASGLRQGGGTGLGMPITKSLVEAHGGRVWLDSRPGQGSTFFVSLPLKAEHLAEFLLPVAHKSPQA
jgi:signal transduction histidine kinase